MGYKCPIHGDTNFIIIEKGKTLCSDCYCDEIETEVERK